MRKRAQLEESTKTDTVISQRTQPNRLRKKPKETYNHVHKLTMDDATGVS